MASRFDEYWPVAQHAPASAQPRAIVQRSLFALALVCLGLASSYGAIALLTRVTPALFPGKELISIPVITNVIERLPSGLEVEAPGETSSFNRRKTVLFIGVDRRADVPITEPFHTDSIMIGTVDPLAKQMSVLSFPRDMWVDIHNPSGGSFKNRINASYGYGILNDPEHRLESGAKQLILDIKENFGIEVDLWVWMDIRGVEALIDQLGGVDVVIDDDLAVYENWYYTDDDFSNPRYIQFLPGKYHLNGYDAVAFGRYRNDSDYKRVKRQQLVLLAAVQRAFKQNIFQANPLGLWGAYKGLIHTNVADVNVPGYVGLLKDTAGSMKVYSVADPVAGLPSVWGVTIAETGAQVVEWEPENIQYWIKQTFTKSIYAQSTVELQNGYGAGGGARLEALGRYLQFERYLPEDKLGPDTAERPTTTIVVNTEDRRPMAEDIAKWLGLPDSAIIKGVRESATDPDVVIVIGQDLKLPNS